VTLSVEISRCPDTRSRFGLNETIIHSFIPSIFIYLPRVYKSNDNSEQIVGQDSKATGDALITAHCNHTYTINIQH